MRLSVPFLFITLGLVGLMTTAGHSQDVGAGDAGAGNASVDSSGSASPDSRLPVAVLGYTNAASGYGARLIPMLDNSMSADLSNTSRFSVVERSRIRSLLQEQHFEATGLVDPETATRLGKLAGARYVVYGTVDVAQFHWERHVYKNGVSYEAYATVTVNHVITDTETGRIWKDDRLTETQSDPFSQTPFTSEDGEAFCRQAAERSVALFVRELVPKVDGRVLAKTAGTVIITLGSRDNIGEDTDFHFFRISDLLDDKGHPVISPDTGKPLSNRALVAALARKGHKTPTACVGRVIAGSVNADHCECQVGYYAFGHNGGDEFTPIPALLDAVQVGDEVETTPRPITSH